MTHKPNGSKPGSIHENTESSLKRVNTIPSADFAIPPSDSLGPRVSKEGCHSHQTRCSGVLEKQEGNEAQNADEESVSDAYDEYPEGGLQAWLVVLGSFFGSVVAFGMM